jgi:hypothetical protein
MAGWLFVRIVATYCDVVTRSGLIATGERPEVAGGRVVTRHRGCVGFIGCKLMTVGAASMCFDQSRRQRQPVEV